MNAESSKDWFCKQISKLSRRGIYRNHGQCQLPLYHRRQIPNTKSRRKDIQQLLRKNRIDYDPTETIPESLLHVAPYKSREKVNEIDQIANEMCHLVIRLPPYHFQYNQIELTWAKVKGEVAQLNTFRLSGVERLVNEAVDRVTDDDWMSRVRHAEQLQEEDFHKEISRDEVIQRININLGDEIDDSESTDTEGEEDDDSDEPLSVPLL
jgi:hypothetical protein